MVAQEPPASHLLEDEEADLAKGPPPAAPSLAEIGFLGTLSLMVLAPLRAFEGVNNVPARVGARFGAVAAFAGILGSAIRTWVQGVPEKVVGMEGVLPAQQYQCLVDGQLAWEQDIFPWLNARVPLAPVLALLLLHGLARTFQALVMAMDDGSTLKQPYERILANVGFALAPMALGGVLPLGGCFMWSLFLCAVAIHKTWNLAVWLCMAIASFPFWVWVAAEFLVAARIALPCLSVG